jgi:diguanylate cyclase (GGDEF)-like protein/PAS domain S-box-containing protein
MLGTVVAKTGDASRRAMAIHRQQILPIAWLLVLAAASLAGLMLFAAVTLDARTREESIEAVRAGLNERADQLDRVVKDYAWWNEAVQAIQVAHDRDWAIARLGPYLYGTHAYDWAFVVAPDDSTFFAAFQGEPQAQNMAAALGNERWRPLVAKARTAIRTIENGKLEPLAVNGFLPMHSGQLGIASATVILPETSWDQAPPPGAPYVLIVVRQLNGDWLEELVNALGLEDVQFSPSTVEPATGLLFNGPDGERVGQLAWQPNRPGTRFLQILAPSLTVALALFSLFGWSALRQSRSTTSAIVESETRFRDVADASSDWIFETDPQGRLTWISERFIALTGISLGDIEGRPIVELLLPMAGEDLSAELDTAMAEHRLFRSIPRCYLDLEGRPRALRVSGKPTRDAAGNHIGWRGTATDVTVEIEARKTAEFLSGHDALTGALNRQGLIEGTTRLLDVARRREQLAAFLLLDLDRFKEVNDVHGPIVGDQLIRLVAQKLGHLGLPGDVIGRLGADEFVLVRPAVGDAQAVQTLAKALQEELALPLLIGDQEIAVTVSVVAILLPSEAETAERALHVAGMVMTRAKEDGRSALRFFEPGMDARLQARKTLERDLARAIENHEFEVFYQPKMNARTRELSGIEALIRWRHPQHGLIAPGLFIPVAEETRMITQIGRWVLEQACRDAAAWGDIQVAVNLSPAQFTDDELLDTVGSALQRSGLAPPQLEVEITEGVLLANNARSNAMMNQFVEMGVHLAMDDFGTGYSSMSYLTKFRFNKIKIDRSFVQALDRGGEAIILAIVGMTKSLGIKSCAEGIETEEQMAALRVIGIDEMQGYLFGRPMPRAELVERYRLDQRAPQRVHRAA